MDNYSNNYSWRPNDISASADPLDRIKTAEDVFNVIKSYPIPFIGLLGMIETVSAFPTFTPVKLSDQIKIYQNTFTTSAVSASRIAIYSNKSHMWISASLT